MDAKNAVSHAVHNPGNISAVWNTSDYAVSLMMFDYQLKFDGNTLSGAYGHVIGLNGLEGQSGDSWIGVGAEKNKILSFTDNTISVDATVKTKRAALKIWSDAVYAAQTDDHNAVNKTAQDFIDVVLAEESNNTFNIVDGYDHTIFCFYDKNTNE